MKTPRLFVGIFPAGISYADRGRELHGDYAKLAFLAFATLELRVCDGCPAELRAEIEAHAATIQARRGEAFEVTASGQTVILGGAPATTQSQASASSLTPNPAGTPERDSEISAEHVSRLLAEATDTIERRASDARDRGDSAAIVAFRMRTDWRVFAREWQAAADGMQRPHAFGLSDAARVERSAEYRAAAAEALRRADALTNYADGRIDYTTIHVENIACIVRHTGRRPSDEISR